ncbi:tyrosine-type recombinase/integrase [Novosphingobium beihaiensis]|uniref:Integrase arm-type DNA-binding domain-containing protein n=1 Tax=Novosphingobium beihaiensis TaxID=2930389 RepID=A0ABT0BT97_9SPHN|nr:integrase arm-type DNA-binding domain-containing protein [Novosphingobium beihaiensis]MCJ2188198.1 integrase arm-type DNA-binding domain-containing protein [Novosphingobium beihaiensis]
MALTFVAIKNAKSRVKPYKLADSAGLYLLVMPNGGRLWRMNYRFNGKQKTLAFGSFPDVSLARAREKCIEARETLSDGIDPVEARKEQERTIRAKSEETFKRIAEEWLDRLELEGRSPATMTKMRWLLDFTYPGIGDRPIADLTAPEILEVLRKVEARGRYETANRLRGTMGTIFRFAIATGRAQRDITFDLRGALITPKTKHHAAILEPKALGALLRAVEGHDGQPVVTIALRMTPHVFVRPGELRTAEWSEFDITDRVWTIPAEKTKMRRVHKVPLSKQVLGFLEELRPLSGDGQFLFPSVRSPSRSITDNTLNAALRRLGYSKDEVTAHGFRATASTLLNEMGKWHPDAIERQLAHVESNEVCRAYARGDHWAERKKMMQFWSDYLDSLRTGAKVLKGNFRKT